MIRELHLTNFRSFRSASVRLGPLTALVGPNASGKSALLQAITYQSMRGDRDVRHWQRGAASQLEWHYESGPKARWRHICGGPHEGSAQHKGQYLHLELAEMRKARPVAEQPRLNETGANLVNVVATIPRRKQEELSRQLCSLIPVLQDIDVRPGRGAGHHRLVFQDRWSPDVWFEPEEVSDGTILTLGLLTVQHQLQPAEVVGIEEPEHGLHPYLLEAVVGALRKLATGGDGRRPLQIVLATQSAALLEFLEPHEVRFLSRDPDTGEVDIEEPDTTTENWRAAYAVHQESLGSLWLSGGVGGVPGE